MQPCRSVNCIVPPHILQQLLKSHDPSIRDIALGTLLATTQLRAERRVVAQFGFIPNSTGKIRRTIYNCKSRSLLDEADLVRGEDADPVQDPSVNRAFDHLGSTYEFYKQVLDRNSIDNRGMRLDGYVHYGRSYNNAFWDGREMVFGDGDGRLFSDFTGSLDVVAHELTHGVTDHTAGLEYHNQSGALNESMSDVFGSLVKQWSRQESASEADWLIGDDIFSPSIQGDGLRSLRAPGRAYDDPTLGRDPQPAHMDGYERLPDTEAGDWGGVHINSGIPNHAFYLVATGIGGYAWERSGQIWYESLRAVGPETEFQEFAETTVATAGRLFGAEEQRIVRAAWREVGIRVDAVSALVERRAVSGAVSLGDSMLADRIDALAARVSALTREVAQLKSQR